MVARNTNDTSRPVVRDHRDYAPPPPASRPQVRDHRTHQPPPAVVHHHHHHTTVVHAPRQRTVDSYPTQANQSGATARAEFDAIMGNNNLSLEDKVMMLLFKVMQGMDQELLDKANKISKAKSGTPGANGGGNAGSAAAGTGAADEQTLELQQLQNRRNNMFSMLAAIVHKFDESTSKVLQKMSQG